MKKFKILGVALLAVIAVCVFFACGSDGDGNGGGNSGLVGTWVRQGDSYKTVRVTLKSDGTGSRVDIDDAYYHDAEIEQFKWKTSGNKLYITITFNDSYYYDEDETDVYNYTLDDDYLYMTKVYDDSYSGGKTYVYKREK